MPIITPKYNIIHHEEFVIPLDRARISCKVFDPDGGASHRCTMNLYVECDHPLFDTLTNQAAIYPLPRILNYQWSRAQVLCAKGRTHRVTLHLQRTLKRKLTPPQLKEILISLANDVMAANTRHFEETHQDA